MTKKVKILIIIAAVVVVLGILTAAVLCWFFSPGVHKLFGFVHVKLEESYYLIDRETGEITKTTVSIEGTGNPYREINRFKGTVHIPEFDTNGYAIDDVGVLTEDDDLQTVHIISWHWIENEYGGVTFGPGEPYYLYIHFPEDNPEEPFIDVYVVGQDSTLGSNKYFLCQADSEADALAQMKEWDD